jgi:hypothetical protein
MPLIIARFRYLLPFILIYFSGCKPSQVAWKQQSDNLDFASIMRALGTDDSTIQIIRFVAPIAYYRDMTPFLYRNNDLNRILSAKEMCKTQKILLPPNSKQYSYYSGGIKEACLDTVFVSFVSPVLTNELTGEKYLQILNFYSDYGYRVVSDRSWNVTLTKAGVVSQMREIESYLNMATWPQGEMPNRE